MRVVHGTSVHSVEDPRILHRECRSLAELGYDVDLVAPNAESESRANGVATHGFSFRGGRLRRMTVGSWRCIRAMRSIPADVYHIHDPELLWAAPVLRSSGRIVVYDSHEDLPRQVLHKEWIPRALRRPLAMLTGWVQSQLLRFVHGVVVPTPEMAARDWPVPVAVVANFPVADDFSPPPSLGAYEARPYAAAYVGALARVRGSTTMVHAANRIGGRDFKLVLAGRADASTAEEMAGAAGWEKTEWLGYLEPDAMPAVLKGVRVGLVLLHPTPSYAQPYATKMFEYMAAGIPFVASSMPAWVDVVGSWGCCLFADPVDDAEIAAAVEWLLDHPEDAYEMGKRGRAIVEKQFSFGTEAESLAELYERLLP